MDIQDIKKFAKNKIEADDLTKQVRRQIKETAWEKQNLREGFSQTFKPLISQFEKPDDPKKKNSFTQNQEMLRNQLALTEGLKENQKAIQGLNQFKSLPEPLSVDKLFSMDDEPKDLMTFGEDEDEEEVEAPKTKYPIAKFDIKEFDKNLNNKETQDTLKSNGYDYLPSDYFYKDIGELSALINNVNSDLEDYFEDLKNSAKFTKKEGYSVAEPKSKNPRFKTLENISNYNALSYYSTNLEILHKFKKQSGSGLFSSPQHLLNRFELLSGSLSAGNNGVLPEFIRIAHHLRDLGIITNNQLNKLLKGKLRFL